MARELEISFCFDIGNADSVDVRRFESEVADLAKSWGVRSRRTHPDAANSHEGIGGQHDGLVRSKLGEGPEVELGRKVIDLQKDRAALESELQQARSEVARVRSSGTYRVGLVVRDALSSPRGFLSAPREALKLIAEKRSSGRASGVLQPKESPESGITNVAKTESVFRANYRPPARIKSPAEVDGPSPATLKIACILDEFSFACFSPEAIFCQLTPSSWREELAEFQPDILLVESAWRGVDGKWHNMVSKNGSEIRGIIEWCNAHGVPTNFWNKEDPVHFETFIEVASNFDNIFTTDVGRVPAYREVLGHDRVFLLPFAAQPRIHNPIERFERVEAASFAGSYYTRYTERARDLVEILSCVTDSVPVEIFDRNLGLEDVRYKFPAEFEPFIVGQLSPGDIDIAYKGYEFSINLNSVKQSQTMFARRAFELIASNTLVLSNYSPAMGLLLGSSVVASDDGNYLKQAFDDLRHSPVKLAQLKVAALREVLLNHTYGQRLSRIAEVSGLRPITEQIEVIAVVAEGDPEQTARILGEVRSQSLVADQVLVIAGDNVDQVVSTLEELKKNVLVAFFSPYVRYGKDYLLDLRLANTYLGEIAVSKAPTSNCIDSFYRFVDQAPLYRSAIYGGENAAKVVEAFYRDSLASATRGAVFQIDGFGYGFASGGRPIIEAQLQRRPLSLSAIDTMMDYTIGSRKTDDDWLAGDEPRLQYAIDGPDLVVSTRAGRVEIVSHLKEDTHRYVYSAKQVPLERTSWGRSEGLFHVAARPGLNLEIAIVFYDGSGARIGHQMVKTNRDVEVDVPADSAGVNVGLRIKGPGSTVITGAYDAEQPSIQAPVMSQSDALVITNIYPAYDDLYRNGFVHSRVKAYERMGLSVDVIALRPESETSYREFKGVRVAQTNKANLKLTLEQVSYSRILVHFLDEDMWEALAAVKGDTTITVWVHGSEVQPWWRREYNANSEGELRRMKKDSAKRLKFWRGVFGNLPENAHFVFVSQYFAEEVFEDVGIRLPDDRYSVIHNPIDTRVFDYVEKAPEQRFKVLSIRPYASNKYANDLSMAAVEELSKRPIFKELTFTFYGDGPMWEEQTAKVKHFPNVDCRRGFLTHEEIASVHKEYGVFLTPTRMDAQGVSRDEAMSSGLVPVTTNVAAIPEFVDESCGMVVPPEDAIALADAIQFVAENEHVFKTLSRNAAARVRNQTEVDLIISKELELMKREK